MAGYHRFYRRGPRTSEYGSSTFGNKVQVRSIPHHNRLNRVHSYIDNLGFPALGALYYVQIQGTFSQNMYLISPKRVLYDFSILIIYQQCLFYSNFHFHHSKKGKVPMRRQVRIPSS
jgi:hypothetical protein